MDNTNTFQQKITKFFNDNYGWMLVIIGLIVLTSITNLSNIVADFTKGYNDGFTNKYNGINNDSPLETNNFSTIIAMILGGLFAMFIMIIVSVFVGNLFHRIFFRFILRENKLQNIIAFILWLIIFFNLIQSGILWLFDKNNAFATRRFMVEGYRQFFSTLLTAFIFIFIIAYGLVKNYIQATKTQAKLIAQKSQAELMALKAQINPHFLFNVLNNLYGSAIVEDSPKTSEGILQLSSIMRHVVEGTKNERIDVEKEIRFLNDYIELNKMRIPNRPNIRIVTEIFWDENSTMIAPLLVIPYIENAFKYGISTTEECFIEMSFRVENQQLSFVCKNSIIKVDDKLEVGTGTGLDNTKRRLDLYYPTEYKLSTSSSEQVFVVNLEVKL